VGVGSPTPRQRAGRGRSASVISTLSSAFFTAAASSRYRSFACQLVRGSFSECQTRSSGRIRIGGAGLDMDSPLGSTAGLSPSRLATTTPSSLAEERVTFPCRSRGRTARGPPTRPRVADEVGRSTSAFPVVVPLRGAGSWRGRREPTHGPVATNGHRASCEIGAPALLSSGRRRRRRLANARQKRGIAGLATRGP